MSQIMTASNTSAALVPAIQSMPLTAGSIDAYIQRINSAPILSGEEERELALRLEQHNDLAADNS